MNIFNVIQSKMVQKNNRWNISREKGETIIIKYMIEIIQDSKDNMISLSSNNSIFLDKGLYPI